MAANTLSRPRGGRRAPSLAGGWQAARARRARPTVTTRVALAALAVHQGRLQRTLSALCAAGAATTALEIFFEHDRASFGNAMMWLPIALGPAAAGAGVAGALNARAARTVLPAVSALVVANGVQGFYLHARGVAQRPGGWREARYNLEMGPPVLAPLLMTMVGGMGLLASVLRREGSRP